MWEQLGVLLFRWVLDIGGERFGRESYQGKLYEGDRSSKYFKVVQSLSCLEEENKEVLCLMYSI